MINKRYKNVDLFIWDCQNPVGVIQIIHGAMEHIKRYDDFAIFMNEKNFLVLGADLPGHGIHLENSIHTLESKKNILTQQEIINEYITSNYKDLTITILGHSMGSIISRVLILNKNIQYENLILTGTFNPPRPKVKMGLIFQNIITSLPNNKHKVSKLSNYLSFGTFDTMSKKKFGSSNWITNDLILYKDYLDDELCQNPFSNNYIKELLTLVDIATKKSSLNALNNSNTFIISGEEDPVSNFGKEILKLKSEILDVNDIFILPNMKHEILNEVDKGKVYSMILNKIRT